MKNIIPAFAKARANFKPIAKTTFNPFTKKNYATLDSVLDSVMPYLLAEGLVIVQQTEITETGLRLNTRLIHTSGEMLESSYPLPDVADPQKLGAAITYARRYSISALLCVCPDEDDDGESVKQNKTVPKTEVKSVNNNSSKPKVEIITEDQYKELDKIRTSVNLPIEKCKSILDLYGYQKSKDIATKDYRAIYNDFTDAAESWAEINPTPEDLGGDF
jgi:peroxiredoxin family protein